MPSSNQVIIKNLFFYRNLYGIKDEVDTHAALTVVTKETSLKP